MNDHPTMAPKWTVAWRISAVIAVCLVATSVKGVHPYGPQPTHYAAGPHPGYQAQFPLLQQQQYGHPFGHQTMAHGSQGQGYGNQGQIHGVPASNGVIHGQQLSGYQMPHQTGQVPVSAMPGIRLTPVAGQRGVPVTPARAGRPLPPTPTPYSEAQLYQFRNDFLSIPAKVAANPTSFLRTPNPLDIYPTLFRQYPGMEDHYLALFQDPKVQQTFAAIYRDHPQVVTGNSFLHQLFYHLSQMYPPFPNVKQPPYTAEQLQQFRRNFRNLPLLLANNPTLLMMDPATLGIYPKLFAGYGEIEDEYVTYFEQDPEMRQMYANLYRATPDHRLNWMLANLKRVLAKKYPGWPLDAPTYTAAQLDGYKAMFMELPLHYAQNPSGFVANQGGVLDFFKRLFAQYLGLVDLYVEDIANSPTLLRRFVDFFRWDKDLQKRHVVLYQLNDRLYRRYRSSWPDVKVVVPGAPITVAIDGKQLTPEQLLAYKEYFDQFPMDFKNNPSMLTKNPAELDVYKQLWKNYPDLLDQWVADFEVDTTLKQHWSEFYATNPDLRNYNPAINHLFWKLTLQYPSWPDISVYKAIDLQFYRQYFENFPNLLKQNPALLSQRPDELDVYRKLFIRYSPLARDYMSLFVQDNDLKQRYANFYQKNGRMVKGNRALDMLNNKLKDIYPSWPYVPSTWDH